METFWISQYFLFINVHGCPGQLARISTNPTDLEVNDHISLQWSWEDSNSWLLKSKLKNWPVELPIRVQSVNILAKLRGVRFLIIIIIMIIIIINVVYILILIEFKYFNDIIIFLLYSDVLENRFECYLTKTDWI